MRKVYVVSSFGRPIAAFDELDDALMLSDAIYGDGGTEHVHETLFMCGASPSVRFNIIGFGGHGDCDGERDGE